MDNKSLITSYGYNGKKDHIIEENQSILEYTFHIIIKSPQQ
jgi:hypothetical protein